METDDIIVPHDLADGLSTHDNPLKHCTENFADNGEAKNSSSILLPTKQKEQAEGEGKPQVCGGKQHLERHTLLILQISVADKRLAFHTFVWGAPLKKK